MDGWVGGWKSRVKDCLQQSKTYPHIQYTTKNGSCFSQSYLKPHTRVLVADWIFGYVYNFGTLHALYFLHVLIGFRVIFYLLTLVVKNATTKVSISKMTPKPDNRCKKHVVCNGP